MNKRMVFYMLGRIILLEAGLLILPTIYSALYREDCITSFLITIGIAIIIGVFLITFCKPKDRTIFAKEGFVIVALAWIFLSAIGALPFYISREIPSFHNAFFETVSGFTTTGSSILNNIECMSKGLLFWRSFTHWVGGMGVLVLIMAIFPTDTGRSMHIMRAEMPGPIIGKLVPKMSSTAKILYLIYIVMTLTEAALLMCGGMPLYESLVHSFGTAGTGGFGVKNDSIAGYSPYIQWVIAIFMLLFGINFNLYYLLILKKLRSVFTSEELLTYLGIVVFSVSAITANIHNSYQNFSDSLRHSVFQVASIVSTTGYFTTDFDIWPTFSKTILFLLMILGACAGSTAGGLKISRVIILFKSIKSNLKHMIHSRSVESIKLEGKKVDTATLINVWVYFALYFLCLSVIFLFVSLEPFNLETNLSAVVACFNNIGPGFSAVGPTCNFSIYSAFSKYALSFAMLLGRLEIYPMILLFSPTIWFKNRRKNTV